MGSLLVTRVPTGQSPSKISFSKLDWLSLKHPTSFILIVPQTSRNFTRRAFGFFNAPPQIGYEELVRVVQYEHLLCDDSSDKLVEHVKVSPAVDGVVNKEIKRPDEYRGLIRPSPSFCVPGTWSLHYGECVGLLHEDAWWEGVVFDHEDGCERRRIFFPDMGDEMEGRVENLRISMDWDEATKEWKPRGRNGNLVETGCFLN